MLTPDGSECIPITAPHATIRVDATGLSLPEIDPSQSARLTMRGVIASGVIERAWTAFFTWLVTGIAPLIRFAASIFDVFLAALGDVFLSAQGQRTQGYFTLVAGLMTDLTGIKVDGDKMFQDSQNKGRLHAMTDLGASLFNALASESVGIEQATDGDAYNVAPGAGIGGLPVHQTSPGDGVKAAQALLGFATSFAVREGNTDMLADYLPYGTGRWFKDFAEDFSKSIGLSRLLRIALRPLFQILVAEPLTHDMNTQYRPTFLKPAEAVRAAALLATDVFDPRAEMAKAGYSEARIDALMWQHEKMPSVQELETLRAGRAIDPHDEKVWFHRLGYTDEVITLLQKARDLEPARKLSLRYLEHYLEQYLQGHLTQASVTSFLDAMAASNRVLVTPGELEAVRAIVSLTATATLRPRHLTIAQLQLAYIDGTITLQEFEQHLTDLGYSAEDVTTLGIETLIKAKDKAATAARKAGKGKHGTPTPGSAASPTPTPGA